MAQLEMYWKRQKTKEYPLPQGFSVRLYNGSERDIDTWVDLCKNGLLNDDEGRESFVDRIFEREDLNPFKDLFFIEKNEKAVATVAAINHSAIKQGYVHMVSVCPDFRGLGLGNCLTYIALKKLYDDGCQYVTLKTDPFRKAAVKSYLSAGFLPVDNDKKAKDVWRELLKEFKIDKIEMLKRDGAHACFIEV